jgi:hypothetical protein
MHVWNPADGMPADTGEPKPAKGKPKAVAWSRSAVGRPKGAEMGGILIPLRPACVRLCNLALLT